MVAEPAAPLTLTSSAPLTLTLTPARPSAPPPPAPPPRPRPPPGPPPPSTAVLLLNLGGPDSLEAVEPFLYNLFRDPDVIDYPVGQWVRNRIATAIARRRTPVG